MLKFSKLFLLLTLISLVSVANAQITRKTTPKEKKAKTEKLFDESGGFKHRLWYGGGLNLGYNQGNSSSTFQFGLSPMVGYKITDKFSAGPRITMDYIFLKGTAMDFTVKKANLFDYSLGVFARYKIFQGIFAHVEYAYESFNRPYYDFNTGFLALDANNKILTYRNSRSNFLPGIGYNSGGLFSMDLLLLFNYQNSQDTKNPYLQPYDIRIGFTYKF